MNILYYPYKNGEAHLFLKIKWWLRKYEYVAVWDEEGKRANVYKKVPNKNWWEQAQYKKI